MAHDFEIDHEFDCDRETFMRLYDGAEFNARFCEASKLRERHQVSREEDDRTARIAWHVSPLRDLPAPLKALTGGKGFGFLEKTVRHKGEFFHEWEILPDALSPDKFKCTGTFRLVDLGGRMRRELRGRVEAKFFGAGGLLERTIVKNTREAYEVSARVMHELISEHKRNVR